MVGDPALLNILHISRRVNFVCNTSNLQYQWYWPCVGHALAIASQSILLTTLIVISPVSIKLPRSHCSNAAQQPMAQTKNLLQAFIFGFKTQSHQTFLDNI